MNIVGARGSRQDLYASTKFTRDAGQCNHVSIINSLWFVVVVLVTKFCFGEILIFYSVWITYQSDQDIKVVCCPRSIYISFLNNQKRGLVQPYCGNNFFLSGVLHDNII